MVNPWTFLFPKVKLVKSAVVGVVNKAVDVGIGKIGSLLNLLSLHTVFVHTEYFFLNPSTRHVIFHFIFWDVSFRSYFIKTFVVPQHFLRFCAVPQKDTSIHINTVNTCKPNILIVTQLVHIFKPVLKKNGVENGVTLMGKNLIDLAFIF